VGQDTTTGVIMHIILVDTEAAGSRYTTAWKTHIPQQLTARGHKITVIEGTPPLPPLKGQWLNASGTIQYKSEQQALIAGLFHTGKIAEADLLLFTDAWNPTILTVRYQSALTGHTVRMAGLWHAGAYDPWDLLAQRAGDQPWIQHMEQSLLQALDYNLFATDWHRSLCASGRGDTPRAHTVGWPCEYIPPRFINLKTQGSRPHIIVPHRDSPEKQLSIARDLALTMTDCDWCITADHPHCDYVALMGRSHMVFSANLQETLGIAVYEGLCAGARPLVPQRLSYREMYDPRYVYPSEWTENWASYCRYKPQLMARIRSDLARDDNLHHEAHTVGRRYFTSDALYRVLGL